MPTASNRGSAGFGQELPRRPGGDLTVAHGAVVGKNRRPVDPYGQGVTVGREIVGPDLVGDLPLQRRIVGIPGGGVVVAVIGPGVEGAGVEQLAGAEGCVAGILEMPGQRTNVLEDFHGAPVRLVHVNAGRRGTQAGHQSRPGRIAQDGGRMRVGKHHAPLGEAVHVGCNRLRMPVERSDPVVQVVDGNEEDVGRRSRLCVQAGSRRSQYEQNDSDCVRRIHGAHYTRVDRLDWLARGCIGSQPDECHNHFAFTTGAR